MDPEPLFWLIYREHGVVAVLLMHAHSLIAARMRAALAETAGEFTEGFKLDTKTAAKVPKAMIGRLLTAKEAGKLLDKISG